MGERIVDQIVLRLHPNSNRTDGEGPQAEQFAHLVNTYRHALGLTGINHASADKHSRDAGEMPHSDRRKATRMYESSLDILSVVDFIVNDVNQPSTSKRRRIDFKDL